MYYNPRRFVSRTIIVLATVGTLVLHPSRNAFGQQAKTLPVFVNGEAQIVPGFQDSTQWIRQDLWVETEFDSDHDGNRDRVHVDVIRPRQTETEGLKIPVIYEASPYYSRAYTGRPEFSEWDVHQGVDQPPPHRPAAPAPASQPAYSRISNMNAPRWVPRGFAVVHSESPGTGRSQGCPTIGGSNEALATKAVIDWLNGRARGFTTADGDEQVVASWSDGKVGMIGTSYDGTLALAAATTGVDGLKAIIPVAPVSSFYEYYRSNGLVRHPGGYLGEDADVLFDGINTGPRNASCAITERDGELAAKEDRATGDSNAFWATRDYLAHVSQIKAAVLMSHGFNDWNVMPSQSVRIYEALKKTKVPHQAYYHQGGHGGNPPFTMVNRWFTRYLYDIPNGVEKDPRAWIVREGDNEEHPTPYADYPNPAAAPVTLYPQTGGNGIGGLAFKHRAGERYETLTDDVSLGTSTLAQALHDSHRLLYATPVLTQAVHLSGWSTIKLRLASSMAAANLSVYLVALPPVAPGDSVRDSSSRVKLITRGWADPQNYRSLTHGEPLVPGRFYPMQFHLQPEDRVIPAGMRLGVMIFSSDKGFTVWPPPGTVLTIDVDATSLTLPIVGGRTALTQAFGQ